MDDQVYATDASSTAYKYPLADANILRVKGKPAGGCRAGRAARRQAGRQAQPASCDDHKADRCSRRARPCSGGCGWAGAAAAAARVHAAAHPPPPLPTAVEVPLDGTVYDLATGKVLSWCPKNTVVRALGLMPQRRAGSRALQLQPASCLPFHPSVHPLAARASCLPSHPSACLPACPALPYRCARCWVGSRTRASQWTFPSTRCR